MEQKEHIATLCALGTLGAAAAGLAFGVSQADDYIDAPSLHPGKRKRPGSSPHVAPLSTSAPSLPRRSVSQPTTPILYEDVPSHLPRLVGWKRLSSSSRLLSTTRELPVQDEASSRASSTSRRSILRPRISASRSTTSHRDSGSSSGWMKRLSSFSSHNASPAPSLKRQDDDESLTSSTLHQRPATSGTSMPNKLVKRSFSQRGLSTDEARGQILRRPATSHQRSQTFRDILSRPTYSDLAQRQSIQDSTLPSTGPSRPSGRETWRPFFETHFPRKRRKSETATAAGQIRVISLPTHAEPVVLRGSDLDEAELLDTTREEPQQQIDYNGLPTPDRRLRRSLSSLRRVTSRRRNFTDPSVQLTRTAAHGTISPVRAGPTALTTTSMLPRPHESPLISDVPPSVDSPSLTSSPPPLRYDRGDSFRPRTSLSASDPPTTSSDADGRVFSDTESIDFKSDTAYDSIATRATTASSNVPRDSKLETIFAARTSDETESRSELWNTLNQREADDVHMHDSPFYNQDVRMHGIGITLEVSKSASTTSTADDALIATPPRTASPHTEDFSMTPVPLKVHPVNIDSSPPLLPLGHEAKEYDRVGDMLDDMTFDDDELDWHSGNEAFPNTRLQLTHAHNTMSSPGNAAHPLIARFQEMDMDDKDDHASISKPSIFDWSEHQQLSESARPKTVHGKQLNGDRCRSSGRKGLPQLHFRSQSVPVNREGPPEELPVTSKYQTWRLGHKPVSEEWSDDFVFDDVCEDNADFPLVNTHAFNGRDSVRSVKIPQAIIDRQPSVHLQFGQVQEFMALVEELKRLRSKAAELQLLGGRTKNLWEDAETIINLATINDDETSIINASPASSDPFTDMAADTKQPIYTARPRRQTNTGRRSVSTMTTPAVHGRARGESLAQARHFLQAMHENRNGTGSSPREIEIRKQRKLPFDTQDLKDLVVRSGVITRALKEEVRKAEGVSISPQKTPQSKKQEQHPLNELFRVPEPQETSSSPCPPLRRAGLPKSRSAHSYLDDSGPQQHHAPFSSPMTLAAVV
ncbi:hypothetical protein LTS08_007438 [Lithohypha guttulata]|nr:hypothetical protein LTS08_007438 [Lithohypha guttulata]